MEQRIRLCVAPDGVRLAYAISGQGPPLVKAANWLSHLDHDWRSPVWRHWMRELGRDHTLIRYDERGCGLSDWEVPDFSFEAWVRDLGTTADARGLDRFPVLGISQGAAVAVAYAARHPERVSALLLYGGYARGRLRRGLTAETREEAEALLHLTRVGWGQGKGAYRQVFSTLMMPDASSDQHRWFDELQAVSTSPENAVRFEETFFQIDVTTEARHVRAPTLVLHSRQDASIPFEEGRILSGLIPDARLVPLDSRNHVLQENEPAWPIFLEEVRAFLGSVAASPATAPAEPSFRELTDRESAILELIAQGVGNAQIARRLFISPKTVRNHITSIFRKLNVSTRAEAIVAARVAGYGTLPVAPPA
jgi:pimeloyl-ACP methyl ester carboxylesterase/DNA-binding CsgD family transcriptional regulator